MAKDNWVGNTLSGRYEIIELLGQGGMSAVYKAKDPNLRRMVAVKIIHTHLSNDPEFVRRFEEEAAAVAQLRHSNIIQVHDFNQDEGIYYMVMEFVPGETLQERLRRLNVEGQRLPPDQAIQFAAQVCEAAEYAHNRGMIHRDIKPANVMLDVYGQAILMDFGIAKIVGGEQHTATGAVIGTAKYMAPEQIRGEMIDGRTDVYAIGVTLFEMLSGAPPFEADSAMTLMMKHINDPIPDLRTIQPETPEGLIAVVEKALAKDPADRYQSAAEMVSALGALSEGVSAGIPVDAEAEGDEIEDDMTVIADEDPAKTTLVGAAAGTASYANAEIDADEVANQAVVQVSTSDPSGGGGSGEASSYSVPSPEAREGESAKKPNRAFIAGGVALAIILLCLIAGGAYAFNQFSGSGDEITLGATQTALSITAQALALSDSETPDSLTETQEPTGTFTPAPPTATSTPEISPTPTTSPTPTVPPGVPYVRINDITLDDEGNYLAEYEVFEFTEELLLDGYHLTFFFDDIPPDQVGSPYETPYYMYAGPSPFAKFNQGQRSEDAQRICALVTKPDHTVVQESGNCFQLPGPGTALENQRSTVSDLGDSGSPTPTATATKGNYDGDVDDDGGITSDKDDGY